MKLKIPLISSVIKYFRIYRRYTGSKILFLISITLLSSFTEGIGIALFLPVLSTTGITAGGTDNVSVFFTNFFQFFGIVPTLQVICLLILIIFTLKGVLHFGGEAYKGYLTSLITHDIRKNIVQGCAGMSYRYYLNSNTGFLSNLVTLESSRAVASFMRFCNVLIRLLTIAVFLCFSFWVSWQFTILTIIFGGVVLYLLRFFTTITKKYSLQTSREYATLHSMLVQSIHAFKYLKATHTFNTIQQKLYKTIHNLSRLQFKTQIAGGALGALTEPLVIFFIVGILLYQTNIAGGSLAPVILSIMFIYRITQNIMNLQREYQTFSSYIGGIETINTAFPEIEANREKFGPTPFRQFNNAISFNNVSFAFAEKKVLKNITFTIQKNTTVAFVGESGAGKTTLVDIMTGILLPHQGTIAIDDTPMHTINHHDWRARIGYVIQDPILFNDTVAHNISLWGYAAGPEQSQEKIFQAAHQAHCDHFIQELPEKYQTIIGDRGVKLSGGQRQRLAIARELFKGPELLILDEATSALDTESEQAIQQSILELKGKITVILIAHRLSTIRNADYIYVLRSGELVEQGTFEGLLKTEGAEFRRMCELQNLLPK